MRRFALSAVALAAHSLAFAQATTAPDTAAPDTAATLSEVRVLGTAEDEARQALGTSIITAEDICQCRFKTDTLSASIADLKLIHLYLIDMRDRAPRREGRRPERRGALSRGLSRRRPTLAPSRPCADV